MNIGEVGGGGAWGLNTPKTSQILFSKKIKKIEMYRYRWFFYRPEIRNWDFNIVIKNYDIIKKILKNWLKNQSKFALECIINTFF